MFASRSSSSALTDPSRAPTLRAAVAEHLRSAIITAEIAPGVLVTEAALVLRLGVSATPVREALVELASEGLIEIEPNRLRRVAPLIQDQLQALLSVQTVLWRLGYEWAISQIQDKTFASLECALDEYEISLARDDRFGAVHAAQDFHSGVIAASGNAELLRVTLDRRALIARFILLCDAASVSHAGLAQHRAILAGLRRRDHDEVFSGLARLTTHLIEIAADQDRFRDLAKSIR